MHGSIHDGFGAAGSTPATEAALGSAISSENSSSSVSLSH